MAPHRPSLACTSCLFLPPAVPHSRLPLTETKPFLECCVRLCALPQVQVSLWTALLLLLSLLPLPAPGERWLLLLLPGCRGEDQRLQRGRGIPGHWSFQSSRHCRPHSCVFLKDGGQRSPRSKPSGRAAARATLTSLGNSIWESGLQQSQP